MTRAFHFAWQTSPVVPVALERAHPRTVCLLAVLLSLGFLACSSSDVPPYAPAYRNAGPAGNSRTNDGGACNTPGQLGCPCTQTGATADCGHINYVNSDYVTCAMGTSRCDGNQWGPCSGNRIVAQSIRGQGLTASGIRTLSTTGGCNTPCDPACTRVVGQTQDVDAGGLTFTDAGISITGTIGAGPGSGPCKGLWCQVAACNGQPKTSVSGIVYDPAGKNPLYNAYVYIPVDPTAPLPTFTSGASCDTCAGAGSVSAVAVAQTGPDGKFTLNNVPSGTGVPLVVQMGKWRRKTTLPALNACSDNPVTSAYSRLPRNRFDGDNAIADIPHMAIASGVADPFECLLLKAGIDSAEIKAPGNNTRIDYYVFNGKNRSPGGAPGGSTLTSSLNTLKTYDVVLLPCEGTENDAHNTDAANLVSFANLGGRVFTTHYGYVWLATPSPTGIAKNQTAFFGTADWSRLDQNDYNNPTLATVDQTFPKGVAFAQWLQNVGATAALGSATINEPRHDARSALNPPSQRWIYGSSKYNTSSSPDMLLSMTFNTPVAAPSDQQCGRVVFSDFHVSADALVSASTCNYDTDCGFGATCNSMTPGTCSTVSCSANSGCQTGDSCTGAARGSCTTQACYTNSECGTGRTCSGRMGSCQVSCYADSECNAVPGNSRCSGSQGTCSAKSCSKTADCGGAGTCNNGTCSSVNCDTNIDCGSVRSCKNAVVGTCSRVSLSCDSKSDCSQYGASAVCSGASSGVCSAGNCYSSSDCGSNGTCNNGQLGTCQKTCASSADCGSLTCVSGLCQGCLGSGCPTGSSCGGYKAGTCSASGSMFPLSCRNGDLSAQEKALEFMLFDLSACVSPDSWTPPVPGIAFAPVTFNLDFTAQCPSDQRPIWREFDWQSQIPNTSTIEFKIQTSDTQANISRARSVDLASSTTSTDVPNWDVAIIDTASGGAFQKVDPPLTSLPYLRIAATLNPTSDNKASPTMIAWEVHYDCVDSQ